MRAALRSAPNRPGPGRALRSLGALTAVTVLAAGTLTTELAAPASPAVGAGVALSGTVLVLAFALAVRVMAALERTRPARRPSIGHAWREFLEARRNR